MIDLLVVKDLLVNLRLVLQTYACPEKVPFILVSKIDPMRC